MKNWPPIPFFVSFLALVAVGVLTTLELTCPICDGTGTLKAAQGLTVKEVTVKLVGEKPIYTFGECGTPVHRIKFTYSVDLNLTNDSNELAHGTVTVQFSRLPPGSKTYMQNAEGEMVEVEYMPPSVPAYVSVPAGSTRNIVRALSFIDDPLLPGEARPQGTVLAGVDMIDPTCGGTGILSFVDWIGAKLRPPSFE